MPPPRLSNYEIGEILGAGTVGTIYAALDKKTQQQVAIKKLHPGVSNDELIRARFKREIVVLERLHHPHIMRYFGGGEDSGQLFYVMEVVDGGTVKDLLQTRGPLQWPAVVEIGRQLCSALQFAHNHGVIHRDLKPGNLMLTRQGEIKLGDFGIARDLQGADITSSGMTVGTHAYMAPEQITGDSSLSGKADLYSLGCCLFEMLVGRTPFVGENFAQLFNQHLRSEPPRVREFVPDCPLELDEIVNQLLAKNPEDRPFNARQVQAKMLQLGDSHEGKHQENAELDANCADANSADVAAGGVVATGKEILRQQILAQATSKDRKQISWARLTVVLACITVAAIAVALFNRN